MKGTQRILESPVLWILPMLVAVVVYAGTLIPHLQESKGGFEGSPNPDLDRLAPDDPINRTPWFFGHRQYSPVNLVINSVLQQAGGSYWMARLAAILLHAGTTFFAFLLLVTLGTDRALAALGAALFAVLSVHADAVASGAGHREILGAMALFGSCALALKFGEPGRPLEKKGWPVFAVSCLILLGLFTSPIVLVLVPLIFLQSLILGRPVPWLTLASAASCSVAYLLVRWIALGDSSPITPFVQNPLASADGLTRVVNSMVLVGRYLATLLLPIHLSADYSVNMVPVFSWASPLTWIRVLALLPSLLILAVFLRRRFPLLSLAIVFFVVTILPFTNLFFLCPFIFRERYGYAAALAFPMVLCAVAGVPFLARRRGLVLACLGLLTVLFGLRTWLRNADWNVPMILRMTTEAPNDAWAYFREAQAYHTLATRAGTEVEKTRLLGEVEKRVSRALAIYPDFGLAQLIPGMIAHEQKKYAEAVEHFNASEKSQGQRTQEPKLYLWRGEGFLQLGKHKEALQDLEAYMRFLENLALEPEYRFFQLRGLAYGSLAQVKQAFKDFNTAIALRQDLAELWNNRGFCRFLLKDYAGAVRDYEKGAEIAQKNGNLYDPKTDSVWRFLERIADVHLQVAKVERQAGNEAKAKEAEELYQRAKLTAAGVLAKVKGTSPVESPKGVEPAVQGQAAPPGNPVPVPVPDVQPEAP